MFIWKIKAIVARTDKKAIEISKDEEKMMELFYHEFCYYSTIHNQKPKQTRNGQEIPQTDKKSTANLIL